MGILTVEAKRGTCRVKAGGGVSGMGVVPVYARTDPSALQTQQMAKTQITHLLGPVPYSKKLL